MSLSHMSLSLSIIFFTKIITTSAFAQSSLDFFLPPVDGEFAGYADLINVSYVDSIEDCANLCLNYTGPSYSNLGCIHFNICTQESPYRCGIGGFNRSYTMIKGSSCSYYQRIRPRNDTLFTQAIPFQLSPPSPKTVVIGPGILQDMFLGGISYLLNNYAVDDLLFNFRKRSGIPQPPGAKCMGWDCKTNWVEGSSAGLFLMGAGGTLQWFEHATLRAMLNELIEGIANCTQENGYIMAFNESTLATDEHPDYTLSWTTHGFLAASEAGNTQALGLIRGMINLFNNHTLLPTFLPPDGGNAPYQTPVGNPPPGWNGVNCSGYGSLTGHTIYLIQQGIIHNTRMALSEVGTQEDVTVATQLYAEDWFLEYLSVGDPTAIYRRQWFSHNYEMTSFEAYLDMYVLTGDTKYLTAMLSMWNMWRSNYEFVGGSVAINEVQYYKNGSYYLIADYPKSQRTRFDVRVAREIGGVQARALAKERFVSALEDYVHMEKEKVEEEEESIGSKAHSMHMHHSHHHHHHHAHPHVHAYLEKHGGSSSNHPHQEVDENDDDGFGDDWGNHPTGEFCGAVFWLKLNQRLHRLFPENETFVQEIETEVFNEGPAHQGANGTGIRYFSNLNGVKEAPTAESTCCEGQGSRLYGSLPEYIFSIPQAPLLPAGVYVDLYATASVLVPVNNGASSVNISMTSNFPYANAVTIIVTPSVPASAVTAFDVALRIPSWAGPASIPITINGQVQAKEGIPGTYYHIPFTNAWSVSTPSSIITFTLPMSLQAHLYTGVTQIGEYQRYAYTYGPILLAALGPWNTTSNAISIPSALVQNNPATPSDWMVPSGDGNSLHFNISAQQDGFMFIPYGEVYSQQFSVYPVFV